jgi:hypothetical protein
LTEKRGTVERVAALVLGEYLTDLAEIGAGEPTAG